jgi:hypothetical protein
MAISPEWSARLRAALHAVTQAGTPVPGQEPAEFTHAVLSALGIVPTGTVGADVPDPKGLVAAIQTYQQQLAAAKPLQEMSTGGGAGGFELPLAEGYDDFGQQRKLRWTKSELAQAAGQSPVSLGHALADTNGGHAYLPPTPMAHTPGGQQAGQQALPVKYELESRALRQALEKRIPDLLNFTDRELLARQDGELIYQLYYSLMWVAKTPSSSQATPAYNRGETPTQLRVDFHYQPESREFTLETSMPADIKKLYPELTEHCLYRTSWLALSEFGPSMERLRHAVQYFTQFSRRRFGQLDKSNAERAGGLVKRNMLQEALQLEVARMRAA